MSESNNFIQRWARLKHESDTTHEADLGGNSLSPDSLKTPAAEAPAAQPPSDAAIDQPFDLASLPSIESIAADTDIVAFLRSGVPAELTRAALRRAWTSDPAIRDFIGIAENQWDFNDPDGIPGFGPLRAAESVPAVFTQVASKLETSPAALAGTATPVQSTGSSVAYSEQYTVRRDAQPKPDESNSAASGNPSHSNETSGARTVTESDRATEEYDASRKRHRHGSALPQ